jgi:hypothetical protein
MPGILPAASGVHPESHGAAPLLKSVKFGRSEV